MKNAKLESRAMHMLNGVIPGAPMPRADVIRDLLVDLMTEVTIAENEALAARQAVRAARNALNVALDD